MDDLAEIARRFDQRPGYKLVDYKMVGLPVYLLGVDLLLERRIGVPLIDEYCMRLISASVDERGVVASLLGLPQKPVEIVLADNIRRGTIREVDGRLSLTENGKDLVRDARRSVTRIVTKATPFDAVLWRPYAWRLHELRRHPEMLAEGAQEISPFALAKPKVTDLNPVEVYEVLSALDVLAKDDRLLSVGATRRCPIRFVLALAMLFRSEHRDGLPTQLTFAIDGRSSDEHEQAFASSGRRKSRYFSALYEKPSKASADLHQRRLRSHVARAPRVSDEKRLRPLDIHGISSALRSALEDAKDRVVVETTTIRGSVLSDSLKHAFGECLARGVRVLIAVHEPNPAGDAIARKWLKNVSSTGQVELIHVRRDAGSYILATDDHSMVVSNAAYLSHVADPDRPFVDQWGFVASESSTVASYVQDLIAARAS